MSKLSFICYFELNKTVFIELTTQTQNTLRDKIHNFFSFAIFNNITQLIVINQIVKTMNKNY